MRKAKSAIAGSGAGADWIAAFVRQVYNRLNMNPKALPPMAYVVRAHTTVLPDQRVEVSTPDIPAGAPVEVVVTAQTEGKRRILEFLDSLPPGPHWAASWEEVEKALDAERNAWDS